MTAATTDQIVAHVRDLTPGQRVEFILALAQNIERQASALVAAGVGQASYIGLSTSLIGLAAGQLRETIPGECVADALEQINALLIRGGVR